MSDSPLENVNNIDYGDDDKAIIEEETPRKPVIDPAKKNGYGRPAKEIAWDDSYTGALRKCAYNGHDDLWGDDVPAYLQPQYFYTTTSRCIYCYKYLCNQRHAAKVKDFTTKESKSGKKKRSKKQREGADDDDEQDDGDDHDVGEDGGNDGNDSRGKKRTKTKVPVAGKGARLLLQPAYVAPRLKDFMEKGDQLFRAWLEGPSMLNSWTEPSVSVAALLSSGATRLILRSKEEADMVLEAGQSLKTSNCLFLNATDVSPCTSVEWVSSDVAVVGGKNRLQVWSGLHQFSQPRLVYTLILHTSSAVLSVKVLPRSGIPGIRHAVCVVLHEDGRVRLHSLPIPQPLEPEQERASIVLSQSKPSPISVAMPWPAVHISVCSHPHHPNRVCIGYAEGSLRFIDVPEEPAEELPPLQGVGGAGFGLMAAGLLPGEDFAFWAIGSSPTVSIGDIREAYGSPGAPAPSQAARSKSDLDLFAGDSSLAFRGLIAGGGSGHVWVLPFNNSEPDPALQPRLLVSLNGTTSAVRCHPFLPLALVGSGAGTTHMAWLPSTSSSPSTLTIVHTASFEGAEKCIRVDSIKDAKATEVRSSGVLSVKDLSWAPNLDGSYAIAIECGLIRIGIAKEFIVARQ